MGSGGGGSPSEVTQTSVTEPPEEIKPYIGPFMQRAVGLSNTPFQEWQGNRVEQLNPLHYAGMDLGMATGGMLKDILDPNFADRGGPAFNRMADQLQGRYGNLMAQQGLSNSGAAQQQARDYNDLATTMYRPYYQMQLNAIPQVTAAAQNFLGAGDILREQGQANINEQIRAFEAQRMHPYQMMDVYANALRTGYGGGGTMTSTGPGYFQPSRTAGMLGGAALGYGLGGIPGAIGGGVLGGFA